MKNAKAWILIQIATVLNVFVGIIVAHNLVSIEFGKFATVTAAVSIMVSILNPLINEVSRIVSKYNYIGPRFIIKLTAICSTICIIISTLCCWPLIENLNQAILLAVILPITFVVSSWPSGILIGTGKLVKAGYLQIIAGVSRFGALLLALNFTTQYMGPVWAYIIGFAVTIFIGCKLCWTNLKVSSESLSVNYTVIIGFFLLALPFSFDQVLVQRFYPQVSGAYAAVMTYSKIIMLVSVPALTIAFGSALQLDAQNLCMDRMFKSIIKISGVTVFLVIVFWLISPFCFSLLLGSQYSHLITNLWLGLISIGLHVVSYMIFQTLVLSAKRWLIPILLLPTVLQGIGIILYGNNNIENLTLVTAVVFSAQLILALIASIKITNRQMV